MELIDYLEVFISLVLIPLAVYIFQRFKKVKINKKLSKTYSTDLSHSLIDNEIDFSYGRAEINLQLENHSKFNKSVGIKDLEVVVSNYEKIKVDNIILDYDFKSSEKIIGGQYNKVDGFYLYAINNAANKTSNQVNIKYIVDNKELDLSYPSCIDVTLDGGMIKEILKIDFSDRELRLLFSKNHYKTLKLHFEIDGFEHDVEIKFVNSKFEFRMGQFGSGSPVGKEKVQNLLIDRNSIEYNHQPISIAANSQDLFTYKIFSPVSSQFQICIKYRNKIIYSDKVKIIVPIYNVRNYSIRILYFNQFSKFMLENDLVEYNFKNKFYDSSKLYFYNYEDYYK